MFFIYRLFCWAPAKAGAQRTLHDDTLVFTVLRKSQSFTKDGTITLASYFIKIKGCNPAIHKFSNKELLGLFFDTTTDWATNLILYAVFQKEALSYWNRINNSADWLHWKREEDMIFWRRYLAGYFWSSILNFVSLYLKLNFIKRSLLLVAI